MNEERQDAPEKRPLSWVGSDLSARILVGLIFGFVILIFAVILWPAPDPRKPQNPGETQLLDTYQQARNQRIAQRNLRRQTQTPTVEAPTPGPDLYRIKRKLEFANIVADVNRITGMEGVFLRSGPSTSSTTAYYEWKLTEKDILKAVFKNDQLDSWWFQDIPQPIQHFSYVISEEEWAVVLEYALSPQLSHAEYLRMISTVSGEYLEWCQRMDEEGSYELSRKSCMVGAILGEYLIDGLIGAYGEEIGTYPDFFGAFVRLNAGTAGLRQSLVEEGILTREVARGSIANVNTVLRVNHRPRFTTFSLLR